MYWYASTCIDSLYLITTIPNEEVIDFTCLGVKTSIVFIPSVLYIDFKVFGTCVWFVVGSDSTSKSLTYKILYNLIELRN